MMVTSHYESVLKLFPFRRVFMKGNQLITLPKIPIDNPVRYVDSGCYYFHLLFTFNIIPENIAITAPKESTK